jgi:hypothetical protein
LAADVARAGTFDLDHACAEVGEARSGERTGEELREVEDEKAFEGFHAKTFVRARE